MAEDANVAGGDDEVSSFHFVRSGFKGSFKNQDLEILYVHPVMQGISLAIV